jgi:hypothetical protein
MVFFSLVKRVKEKIKEERKKEGGKERELMGNEGIVFIFWFQRERERERERGECREVSERVDDEIKNGERP